MYPSIESDALPILKTASLPKTGGEYRMVSLSAAHIDQILALQDIIFNSLSAEEQGFLLKKNRSFFEDHFAKGNIVIGVVHDGHLVAQSIVLHPSLKHPKTGMVDMPLKAAPDKITILQGVIVHPDYRGNRLMTAMVDVWLEISKNAGRTHAISEVAIGNFFSWSVFMKEGLQIHSIGQDPADGTQVYNLHASVASLSKKRLTGEFNKKSAKNSVQCPQTDLQKQKELLSKGYKGTRFNPANDAIEFKPPKRRKPS